jgi:glutathione synthase/RimK-type ligase-like ATP-grasp enzyme
MSLPDALHRAENKVVQLKLAQSLGFKIPDILITNSKEAVRQFAKKNKQSGTVIKPLFSGRIESSFSLQVIYTSELTESHLNLIDEFDLTPCIFQEKISKAYELRVTVVGREVFAARVNSQENENTKVDWRRERLAFVPYSLPQEVSNRCVKLVQSLNLSSGQLIS